MRTSLAGLITVCLITISGCASFQSKWKDIKEGDSEEKVTASLGAPDEFAHRQNGAYQEGWRPDAFHACALLFSKDHLVLEKACNVDSQGIARANAAALQYWQSTHPVQSSGFVPAQSYQPARPIETNCSYGGYNSINCTSRPSGVDTSIYNR